MQNNINMIREKIANYGTPNLTTAEILELITGKQFSIPKDDAESSQLLNNLIKKNINEMMYSYGLTKKQALLMQAIFELNNQLIFSIVIEFSHCLS